MIISSVSPIIRREDHLYYLVYAYDVFCPGKTRLRVFPIDFFQSQLSVTYVIILYCTLSILLYYTWIEIASGSVLLVFLAHKLLLNVFYSGYNIAFDTR